MYQSLLSSFSTEVHTAKSSHFHSKINSAPDMRNLFRIFNYLLCPPPTPPTTSITADDFATFLSDKTKTISSQFSPSLTQDLQPIRSSAQTHIFSFCPLTEAEVSKLLLSSHPTTCPLDPIPSHLLQAISPTLLPALTHIINISPHRHLPHCIQAGSGYPTAQKTYIKHFSYRKLQTCLSSSIHSQNTRTSCLQPGLIVFFQRTTNWTLNSQVSGVAIQLRLCYSQSLKPCELQKLIPNHQSSFCWICLPLLTLSIIRSSCPPSHHWTSLGFHFAGLNPISLIGLSRWPGEGRYPKHINWSLGFPRARSLDPSSSPHTLHHWVPS